MDIYMDDINKKFNECIHKNNFYTCINKELSDSFINSKPYNKNKWNTFDCLHNNYINKINDINDEYINFIKTLSDNNRIIPNTPTLLSIINNINKIENKKELFDTMIKYYLDYNISTVISIDIYKRIDSNEIIPHISNSKIFNNKMLMDGNKTILFISNFIKNYINVDQSEIMNLYNLFILLSKNFTEDSRYVIIEDLINIYPNLSFFNNSFDIFSKQLYVKSMSHCKFLNNIITDINIETWKLYFYFNFLYSLYYCLDDYNQNIYNDYFSVFYTDEIYFDPLNKNLFLFKLIPDYLEEKLIEYYSNYYNNIVPKVFKIYNNIVNIFKNNISVSTYLSNESKLKLLNKLINIKVNIGIPKYRKLKFHNIDLSKDILFNILELLKIKQLYKYHNIIVQRKDLLDVYIYEPIAFYSVPDNSITIPQSLLHYPFVINNELEQIYDYAGIGIIIAHELTHAFDLYSIHIDYNTGKSILSDDELDHYYNRVEYLNNIMIMNNIDTDKILNETVADINGISICLQYVKSISKDYSSDIKKFLYHYTKTLKSYNKNKNTILKPALHLDNENRVNTVIELLYNKNFFTLF